MHGLHCSPFQELKAAKALPSSKSSTSIATKQTNGIKSGRLRRAATGYGDSFRAHPEDENDSRVVTCLGHADFSLEPIQNLSGILLRNLSCRLPDLSGAASADQ